MTVSDSLSNKMFTYGSVFMSVVRNGGICIKNGVLRFIMNVFLFLYVCLVMCMMFFGFIVMKKLVM